MTLATCDSAASMISFSETFPLVTTLLTPETSVSTGGDLSIISTTTIETMTAWAPMIQINWRSTDLANEEPSDEQSHKPVPKNGRNINLEYHNRCVRTTGLPHWLSWNIQRSPSRWLERNVLPKWRPPAPKAIL
ncbi:hypothetical protein INS49_008950 [Diaporthe citri]|uniref:uncharacterized protein n=1 Tax=Diaporthe citri TaxID=83186 RepID=UPI001C811413|nr:uncharacterized protein INS49_008950 [Diaporthe citri]KAG6363847.1 hypothetical protein INS49_008950 [Diaporthe citri]